MLEQPGAIHRGKALGLEARQLDLGQAPGRRGIGLAGRRRLAAGQRLGLSHHLGVLPGADLVLANEIHHRLERASLVEFGQVGGDGLLPGGRKVLEAELAIDEVTPITGNERLLVAGLTLAERVAEVDLAVVQAALGQHIDATQHQFAAAWQRQADVAWQRLGVVQLAGVDRLCRGAGGSGVGRLGRRLVGTRRTGRQAQRCQKQGRSPEANFRHHGFLDWHRCASPASRPGQQRLCWPAAPQTTQRSNAWATDGWRIRLAPA